jgi:hypothetical protein
MALAFYGAFEWMVGLEKFKQFYGMFYDALALLHLLHLLRILSLGYAFVFAGALVLSHLSHISRILSVEWFCGYMQ